MKLFVTGNGFDISHSIPSKYSDFYQYINRNRDDILEIMDKYYSINSDSELWSDFESRLEEDINYEELSEIVSENIPNLASDDFRDGDWDNAKIYIEQECDELLKNIRSGFEEWIKSLNTSKVCKKYKLDMSARYFTFNYTEVLELVYKIPSLNILHIHNKVEEELIFGHGKKLENFNVKKALYGNENYYLSEDEHGNIESREVGHEKYAEKAVCAFYDKMRKHTEEIIKNHTSFFKNLSEIDEIVVLGHSYNEIDLPYFKEIAESIKNNAKWVLSYYSDEDKENAKKLMEEIKVTEDFQEYKNCKELIIQDTQLKLF